MAIVPEEMEEAETKRMEVEGTRGANMGRAMMGWTVGIEALGSPYIRVNEGSKREGKGIYHLRPSNQPTLNNSTWLRSEPSRIPNHKIRQFANFYTTNYMTHTLSNGWVDGVLAHISLHAEVISPCAFVFFQGTALDFVLVSRVPGSHNDFAAASHGLRVRGHHADSSKIVQHVLSSNSLSTNTGFSKRYVFGDVFGEMVADHQHVEMLVECVACVWSCWVCR